MKKITQFIGLLALIFSNMLFAQAGANDATFNTQDTGFANGAGGIVNVVVPQPDGQILIGGDFKVYKNQSRGMIARINPDESLDMTFANGVGANAMVWALVLQPDGKIIIGGNFTTYNGIFRNHIARLNTDGSLDSSFDPGNGANDYIKTIALQPDGKIIIGGNFTTFNNINANRIARLDDMGNLDTSYNVGQGANTSVQHVALQSNGKLIAVGDFSTFNLVPKNFIVRLNNNGSIDNSFSEIPESVSAGPVIISLAIQNDDKIYIGGLFVPNLSTCTYIRLNADGTVDSTFNVITNLLGIVESFAIQPDMKIILAANFGYNTSDYPCKIMRINQDGTIDNSFQQDVSQLYDRTAILSLALLPNGKIIAGGRILSYNHINKSNLVCLNSNGSLDTSFSLGNGTGSDNIIENSGVQADGKIIISGHFNYFNNLPRNKFARLNVDGTVDQSYNPAINVVDGYSLGAIQTDQKVIVLENKTNLSFLNYSKIIRLNIDGSIDPTFNFDLNLDDQSYLYGNIVLQDDGKIICPAYLATLNDVVYNKNKLLRFNTDGSLDFGFLATATFGSDYQFTKIQFLQNEKIIVNDYRIRRLKSNGSLDTPNFASINQQFYDIRSFAVQPDQKILISGQSNPGYQNKIVRINSDGTLDTSFSSNTMTQNFFTDAYFLPNGKIILAGDFTDINGVSRKSLCRITNDGIIDESFDSGDGCKESIYKINYLSDDKMIITGEFVSYNNTGRNRIARIFNDDNLSANFYEKANNDIAVYKKDNSIEINSNSKPVLEVKIYDLTGRLINEKKNILDLKTTIDNLQSNHSVLIIKITLSDQSQVSKKIIF